MEAVTAGGEGRVPERYAAVQEALRASPRTWCVTGVAGFIGSNLLETLLRLGQTVTGLDNFATGHRHNLEDVRAVVGDEAWSRFRLVEGDICDLSACREAVRDASIVLHQAALGSVPRSIADPVATNAANVDGFLNVLVAARDARARFVYASSSAVYGDHPDLPKREDVIGRSLSPYAVTKLVNEQYADVFARVYGTEVIGLRYFNVFGPRQDPNGAYAAVIPRWIGELLRGETPTINGDGETSRDFCHVDNAVQANLLAALVEAPEAFGQVFNVANGDRTSLNKLFEMIRDCLAKRAPAVIAIEPVHGPSREGDVRHSQADISKVRRLLGYEPALDISLGMVETVRWFHDRSVNRTRVAAAR